MEQVESITDYLKRRLRDEVGAARFEALSQDTGVATSFIRKFVYGSRENPRVGTVQPLLDYFQAVDRGEKKIADLVDTGEGGHATGGAGGPADQQQSASEA